MTYKEIMSAFAVIQSIICELRGKVDDLEGHARQLWEETNDSEHEQVYAELVTELGELSDALASWEADPEDIVAH